MAQDKMVVGIEFDIEKAKKDLAALTETIKNLNYAGDDNEDTVKALEKQWDQLDKAIKVAEGGIAGVNDSLKGVTNSSMPLQKQLRQVTLRLQELMLAGKQNTKEYSELVARAGQLRDAISDTQGAINKTASDTANLDAIMGAASAATGGFGLFTAGMSLLGKDTEDVEKAQKKLQQAILLVNSVQQISNALNKNSALIERLRAVANDLLAKSMRDVTTATKGATTATKGFKAALVTTGVGAIVAALGLVIGKVAEYVEKTNEAKKSTEDLKDELESLRSESASATVNATNAFNTYKKAKKEQEEMGLTDEEILERRKKELSDLNAQVAESEKQYASFEKIYKRYLREYSDAKKAFAIDDRKDNEIAMLEAEKRLELVKVQLEGTKGHLYDRRAEATEMETVVLKLSDDIAQKNEEAADAIRRQKEEAIRLNKELDKQIDDAKLRRFERGTKDMLDAIDDIQKAEKSAETFEERLQDYYFSAMFDAALEKNFRMKLLEDEKKERLANAKETGEEVRKINTLYQLKSYEIENEYTDKKKALAVKVAEIRDNFYAEIEEREKERVQGIIDSFEVARASLENLSRAFPENVLKVLPELSEDEKNAWLKSFQDAYDSALISQDQFNALSAELDRAYLEQKQQATWATAANMIDFYSMVASYAMDMYTSIASMEEETSKDAFEKSKRAQIASAWVNGLTGAAGAYAQAMSTYGAPLGYIIGTAASAATIANTVAATKKIKAQKWSGASEGGYSTSTPSVSTGTSSVASAIITRTSAPSVTEAISSSQPVLVVDEVTYKQKQMQNLEKVTTI